MDLARNFELLPGFLTELRPTLARLGELADEQTPLLVDLRGAAPELYRLTQTLPPFNDATERSLRTLGDAADIGRRALEKGADEIRALRQATNKSFSAADALANFLVDLDDPARAVENDTRAARDSGRPNPTGYTGLEGLLNYVYYQALAINQFDEVGHLLHFTLAEFEAGPCGSYNADTVVPSKSGGETTSAADRNRCVAWVGPNQPGINEAIIEQPYHPSVCPQGSESPELCGGSAARNVASGRAASAESSAAVQGAGSGSSEGPGGDSPLVPGAPELPQLPVDPNGLGGLLGLGNGDRGPRDGPLDGGGGSSDTAAQDDLLDFLFGN